MATATRTSTINDPTTLTATAPSTSYPIRRSSSRRRSPTAHADCDRCGRISPAILEAGSVPSHPARGPRRAAADPAQPPRSARTPY